MKNVVLLRGVNVGGNKKVPKADFKQVLESLGCTEVIIYINSGNAIFDSPKDLSQQQIQEALEQFFGFSISTLLIKGSKIVQIAEAIPQQWANDKVMKSDVVFLFDEINDESILTQLGYKSEVEHMIYVEGAVLSMITRENQSKSSLKKLVGTKLYSKVTVRNVNTVRKLAELIKTE